MEPIDLYTWSTPNGYKIAIMLEECGLPYRVHPVSLPDKEQRTAEYLAHAPNGKIPSIVDPQGLEGKPVALFESGVILMYLGTKANKFFPTTPLARLEVMQWLVWQVAEVGPLLGQAHHFRKHAPEQVPYAIERYTAEAARIYQVLNKRLGESPWAGGADYSIADIALWPWIRRHEWQGQQLENYPHIKRWFDTIAARPAVQRGLQVPPKQG